MVEKYDMLLINAILFENECCCLCCFHVFFAVAVTRRLRLMLHLGRVPQAIAGSVPTHGVQALPGHRIFSKAGAAC